MGVCSCITAELASCVLKLINSILMVLGLILAAAGAIIRFGGPFVFNLFNGILNAAADAGSSVGGLDRHLGLEDLQKIVGSWYSIVGYAGLVLLIVGLFLIGLGILGWVAFCCRLKIALLLYVIIMAVFTTALAAATLIMLTMKPNLQQLGAEEMKRLVREEYQDSSTQDRNDFSQILDIFQARVGCCGVENYTDFYSAGQWNRNYYLESESRNVTLVAPIACCQLKVSNFEPKYPNCTYAPSDSTSNWRTACYTKIWEMLNPVSNVIVSVLGVATAVMLSITILAILVFRHHLKNDVTPV